MSADRRAQGSGRERKGWLECQPRVADPQGQPRRGGLHVIHLAKRRNDGRRCGPENHNHGRRTWIGLGNLQIRLGYRA